jgi:ankyrin repeat protein
VSQLLAKINKIMSTNGESIYKDWAKAIEEIDLNTISELINTYPKLINQGIIHYRGNGATFQTLPLNMVNKSLEASKLLVENGADPNEYGDGNVLALHNASAEVTKYLISQGADVNRIGAEECTPIMYEVYMHNHENVQILIDNKADVNYQSKYDGYTSLHWAARKGDLQLVRLLLKHGARVQLVNNKNQTPLDLARENNHDNVYEYLNRAAKNKLI